MSRQDVMAEVEIVEAESERDHDEVRALCRAFRAWLGTRYAVELIEGYYPIEEWEVLLARLPEIHAKPAGIILLARIDGETAGCVMMSPFEPGTCEMKRMFVAEAARGRGVARALCDALFEAARAAGYHTMRLDTGPLHREARALYKAMGFHERSPYYDPGPVWRGKHVCMERAL